MVIVFHFYLYMHSIYIYSVTCIISCPGKCRGLITNNELLTNLCDEGALFTQDFQLCLYFIVIVVLFVRIMVVSSTTRGTKYSYGRLGNLHDL